MSRRIFGITVKSQGALCYNETMKANHGSRRGPALSEQEDGRMKEGKKLIVTIGRQYGSGGSEIGAGSLTPENLASLMAAYFFVKFRKFLVRNSVIYDIIRLYHLS